MPLNKQAAWGAPPPSTVRAPGLVTVTRDGLAVLNHTLKAGLPGPDVATPSSSGLRVVWSMGPVRDALTDQHAPSRDNSNRILERHEASQSVQQVLVYLHQHYPHVAVGYRRQFHPLQNDGAGFDPERRTRLAELAAFEIQVMATVQDVAAVPAGARRARKAP